MNKLFKSFLVFLLTYTQAFADSPVIWNGAWSKNLTQNGFLMSNNQVVTTDGLINYVKNGHGEVSSTGWTAYNGGTTTPTTCTGGSPSETITQSTSSPLIGTGSLVLTKGATSRQGDGASYPFTIDAAYKSTPLQIKVTALGSANYAASDVGIYIYDVTNAQLITPAAVNIAAGTFTLNSFFVATTSTSYRLCVHTQSTNASAWTLQLDAVSVGPQSIGVGPALSGWETSTGFTYSGFGTVSTQSVQIKRVSDTMVVRGNFTSGTAAASQAYIILPSGYHINTSAISTTTRVPLFGFGVAYSSAFTVNYSGAGNPFGITYDGTNTDRVALSEAISSNSFAARNGNNVCIDASGDILSFEFEIPIAEWAGSANNSIQGNRAVEEYASNDGSGGTAANNTYNTGMQYGLTGSQFVSVASTTAASTTRYLVRFQQAIQPTDKIFIEVYNSSSGEWADISYWSRTGIKPILNENDSFYGMGWEAVGPSTPTDIYVAFGNKGRNTSATAGAGFGANGQAWADIAGTPSYKWRVHKISGGALTGYPISTDNVLGSTTGLAPAAGYIGQTFEDTPTTAFTTTATNIVTRTLQPGNWKITAMSSTNSSGVSTSFTLSISTTSATHDGTYKCFAGLNSVTVGGCSTQRYVNISSPTTYYIVGSSGVANLTSQITTILWERTH